MDESLLKEFPIQIQWPVAWGEMDSWGHVNNVAYFRYFESARIAYFEKIDYLDAMQKTGKGAIVASQNCRYKMPLYYPDTLTLGVRVKSIYTYGFFHEYCLVSHAKKKIAAIGECRLTIIDYKSGEKVPISEELKKSIETIEGHPFSIDPR